MSFVDLEISIDELGEFDLSLDSDGDFSTVSGYETAIQMSILCERRANADQVKKPSLRRGWLGNEDSSVSGFEIGSLIWLYYQQRLTSDVASGIEVAARDGLNWFLEDNLVEDIKVITNITKDTISLNVDFSIDNAPVETYNFVLWERTQSTTVKSVFVFGESVSGDLRSVSGGEYRSVSGGDYREVGI
jgi:phage gp46-like protein